MRAALSAAIWSRIQYPDPDLRRFGKGQEGTADETMIFWSNKLNLAGGHSVKRAALIIGIIFLVLTFAGGAYVLINHGQVNAGYAVIPGIWCMICFGFYRGRK